MSVVYFLTSYFPLLKLDTRPCSALTIDWSCFTSFVQIFDLLFQKYLYAILKTKISIMSEKTILILLLISFISIEICGELYMKFFKNPATTATKTIIASHKKSLCLYFLQKNKLAETNIKSNIARIKIPSILLIQIINLISDRIYLILDLTQLCANRSRLLRIQA